MTEEKEKKFSTFDEIFDRFEKIKERVMSMFNQFHSLRGEDVDENTTNTNKHTE